MDEHIDFRALPNHPIVADMEIDEHVTKYPAGKSGGRGHSDDESEIGTQDYRSGPESSRENSRISRKGGKARSARKSPKGRSIKSRAVMVLPLQALQVLRRLPLSRE